MPYDSKWLPYQGGSFEGIKQKLPYLKQLGVGAIWLSPVLKNPLSFTDYYGGYATLDFLNIEPRFCKNPAAAQANPALADKEFRELVDAAHAHGLYVILDIVLNHVGNLFDYEGQRDSAPWKPDGGEYGVFWRNPAGIAQGAWTDIAAVSNLSSEAGVWPKELQHNDYFRRRGVVGTDDLRGDFYILKELVTEYLDKKDNTFPIRNILIRAYQYLIAKFDLDGYRIDTLMYIERDFARIFGNSMREFALSIGKKNFFTFGEVWKEDDENLISQYHGRSTSDDQDVVGIDAVLDFPIFRRLRDIVRAQRAPSDLAGYYEYRKSALKSVVSTHGESGRFFVTFLDNHDLPDRLYYQDSQNPGAWDDQFTLGLTLLYSLTGIPCLYYGSEQGLHGHSPANDQAREYAREAMWGKTKPFDPNHAFYKFIQSILHVRNSEPALRYGRQYFREVSIDGVNFGFSPYPGGIVAFSRILNDREVLIVANTNTASNFDPFVTIDRALNPTQASMRVLLSNQPNPTAPTSAPTVAGRAKTQVHLRKMEAQILTRI